jgi:hypothetical protein
MARQWYAQGTCDPLFFFDFLGLPDVIRCWQNFGLNLICIQYILCIHINRIDVI